MEYYEQISEGYDKLYEQEQLKKLRIISKYFIPKPLMLDLGAGTCICAKYFSDIETVSVDSSAKMLALGIGKRIVSGAESIPLKDKMFDSVISMTAFHHFEIDKVINEIRRLVKPGSAIAVTLLKKSNNYDSVRSKLLSEFFVNEYDCVNDTAFIGKV